VHLIASDCSQDRLLVPGGVDPAFGPADVNPAQAPHAASALAPSSATRIGRLSLKPRAFRGGGRGTKVRYTLSAARSVTVTVTTAKGKPVKGAKRTNGKAGANTLRFRGRLGSKQLRPGTYRLVLTPAGSTAASVRFKLLR